LLRATGKIGTANYGEFANLKNGDLPLPLRIQWKPAKEHKGTHEAKASEACDREPIREHRPPGGFGPVGSFGHLIKWVTIRTVTTCTHESSCIPMYL